MFNFKEQALHYCKSDVDILATGCLKVRDTFLQETGVAPVSKITLAPACMKVFLSCNSTRANHNAAFSGWNGSLTRRVRLSGMPSMAVKKEIGNFFVDGYAERGSGICLVKPPPSQGMFLAQAEPCPFLHVKLPVAMLDSQPSQS